MSEAESLLGSALKKPFKAPFALAALALTLALTPAVHAESASRSVASRPTLPALKLERPHGFYLHLAGGYGGAWVSSVGGQGHGDAKTSIAGSGGAFDVLVGGSVTRSVVLGGGSLFHFAVSPTLKLKGATGNLYPKPPSTIGSLIIGPMIDIFPDPSRGFHFGGLVGVSGMNLKDSHGRGSVGAGAALWAGYMWPVSRNWSIGGLARVSAAWTGRTIDDPSNGSTFSVTDTSRTATLMFSAAVR